MIRLDRISRWLAGTPATVVAVVAAGWLGLVAAPCLAMSAAPAGEIHSGDCGHCPPADDCHTAEPVDCAGNDDSVVAPRLSDLDGADAAPSAPVTAPAVSAPPLRFVAGAAPPPLPASSLQQRYCRYLK